MNYGISFMEKMCVHAKKSMGFISPENRRENVPTSQFMDFCMNYMCDMLYRINY